MDYLDMRVFSTVNTDQSFINWAKTSRTVSTRNQCRKQIQRTWPQCSDWVGFRENTTKTTVPFIITFKMKQHGWKNTRIDLTTFPSAALPSGKEHLIEFKRMKPPQYLNEWHQSECYTLRKISPPKARSRCQGTRLDTTWTSDRHTSPVPPPLSHPALHAGTPSLLSFRKDGRRAAATPPDPGRFSPELSPLRRARCARPGPLEQPHHQQPAVLPEQLFPVRTGPPAHSGVSFIILTWPPPPRIFPPTANILRPGVNTELVFGFSTSARCLCSRQREWHSLVITHSHRWEHTGLDELMKVTSPIRTNCCSSSSATMTGGCQLKGVPKNHFTASTSDQRM